MQDVVDRLSEEYGWSDSVSNLSAKLQRESIRYKEVVELAAMDTQMKKYEKCFTTSESEKKALKKKNADLIEELKKSA